MKVKTIAILVTRDAMTILPSEIPEYELPIAQSVFGSDNVEVVGASRNHIEVEPEEEAKRLAAKWGEQRVVDALGPQFAALIGREVIAAEVKETKGAKTPA